MRGKRYRKGTAVVLAAALLISMNGSVLASQGEKEEDELKLSWQKPDSVKDVLTYTVYYSLTDSINPTSARNILMTGIRDTSIYLPEIGRASCRERV